MGFFALKFWKSRRKNKGGEPILSGWKNKKSSPEKVTPWYGFNSETVHPAIGQQSRDTRAFVPDQVKADLLPTPSFASGSRSSSNSTVQSHPLPTSQSPTRSYTPASTARPSTQSYTTHTPTRPPSSSSPTPPTQLSPIVRSPSVSSHATSSSSASTTISSYPLTVATYAFNPTRDDEMPLLVGMSVRVVAPFDDGWAWVVREDDVESRGMVPCECLEMYTNGLSPSSDPSPSTSQPTPWDDKTLWANVSATKRDQTVAGSSKRMSMMTVTDVSERSSSLNHSYGSSTSTTTSDLLWLKPKRQQLRVQNPDTDY